MNLDANYRANSYLIVRVYDNLKFATRSEIGNRAANAQPNWCEKLGNAQLWMLENMPGKIRSVTTDPRFVTLAITLLALYGTSYGFYRQITRDLTREAIKALPEISTKVLRFAAYLFTVNSILGYHNRAQGRFWNTALTNQFWNRAP